MSMRLKNINIFLVFFLMFFLSGCARLEWLDNKAGEVFFNADSADWALDDKKKESDTPDSFKDLSKEHKEKIDEWLLENNLNRYGDEMGIFYAGGTPLFNEVTGASKERFEYILEKIPDILEKIK